jgi:diacylglycerol kinase family enzyme
MRTGLLIFNNSKYTGGKMMLAPPLDTSDGLMGIVRWTAGRFDFISNFSKVYDGSHRKSSARLAGPGPSGRF